MPGVRNVTLNKFRKFLEDQSLQLIKTNGSHEKWSGRDLLRPVII